MIGIYSIALFCIEVIAFTGCAFILFKTHSKTKYIAHLIQGVSFCFFLVNVILRFVTSFFDTEVLIRETADGIAITVVGILWALMNIFLILGICLLFISFFYIKMNRFHPLLNLVSIIIGANIFVFSYPTFTVLEFDPIILAWKASYNILVTLLIIPLLIVFVISIFVPVITKIVKTSYKEQRNQMVVQLFGIFMVLTWSFLAAFTSYPTIALIRPFLLPAGWIIWSATLIVDPFNVMISNSSISQLYITTESGIPFYYKDLSESQYLSSELAASVISGVKSALEELVQEEKITVMNYEKQVLGIVQVGYLTAYVFGERFDHILETVLRFSLQTMIDTPKLDFVLNQQVLAMDDEFTLEIDNLINDNLKSVLVI
ncbi:MAG: hypothetical protein ACTSO7_12430 [Candidatus Heimdallarchaeota archaeon]